MDTTRTTAWYHGGMTHDPFDPPPAPMAALKRLDDLLYRGVLNDITSEDHDVMRSYPGRVLRSAVTSVDERTLPFVVTILGGIGAPEDHAEAVRLAAVNGQTGAMKALIAYGADAGAIRRALAPAARWGHTACVQLMLEVMAAPISNQAALAAVLWGNWETAGALLHHSDALAVCRSLVSELSYVGIRREEGQACVGDVLAGLNYMAPRLTDDDFEAIASIVGHCFLGQLPLDWTARRERIELERNVASDTKRPTKPLKM